MDRILLQKKNESVSGLPQSMRPKKDGTCRDGYKFVPSKKGGAAGGVCVKINVSDTTNETKNESKNIDEGKAIINNYFTSLLEGAEDKAELVMASKDMVDRVTGWMEDTAEMQAESMLELGDAIRDEMGQAESETFIGTVKPALESLYTALESTRAALTNGVAQITGEGGVPTPMGDEEPAMDAGMDAGMDAEMEPTIDAEDDFGGSEAAVGGEAEAGREKRESKIAKKKMIETSRRLGTILSTSK